MTVPDWFRDAKLGLFVHWGLYSLPGWAPLTGDLVTILRQEKGAAWFSRNPYSEWYWNSIQIPGSPAQRYHQETYGTAFAYPDLAPGFQAAADRWDPEAWADLFQATGARYVVFVTKHHDGFLLWPSQTPNPYRPGWQVRRDLVGELAAAVRTRGLRLGLYYSGGLDWTFNPLVIQDFADLWRAIPQQAAYATYADAHWRELIARYAPALLWNDIGYPAAANLRALFKAYRAQVPDGVVNDRFLQLPSGLGHWLEFRAARRTLSWVMRQALLVQRPGPRLWPGQPPADFSTLEYTTAVQPRTRAWEACRGLGHSFGYNRQEGPEQWLTVEQLIHLLVDVVSKNGNLLLGIGPQADGTLSEFQPERLREMGRWLVVNGVALFGTRPWERAAGKTADGLPVRYTRRGATVYAIVLGQPVTRQLTLLDWPGRGRPTAWWLGGSQFCPATAANAQLTITLPENLPASPAQAFALTGLA